MLKYTASSVCSGCCPYYLGLAPLLSCLMHAVPGGPWDASERPFLPMWWPTSTTVMILDDPLWVQYGKFLGNAVRGDLGISYTNQDRDVAEVIRQGLPATAILAGLALSSLPWAGGIPLGVMAASRQNSAIDFRSIALATVFASVPGFMLGHLVGVDLSRWPGTCCPARGWGSPSHVVLPALALVVAAHGLHRPDHAFQRSGGVGPGLRAHCPGQRDAAPGGPFPSRAEKRLGTDYHHNRGRGGRSPHRHIHSLKPCSPCLGLAGCWFKESCSGTTV